MSVLFSLSSSVAVASFVTSTLYRKIKITNQSNDLMEAILN